MLTDLRAYEQFIYALHARYPEIQHSTLVLIPHGAAFAELTGILLFNGEVRLSIWEDIDFAEGMIQGYSYAVERAGERLYWYDPQPHPHHPELASTHPHHKHVPPDIKRHRIPAPGLSFTEANLPFLIDEVLQTVVR